MDRIAQLMAIDQALTGLDKLLSLNPAAPKRWGRQLAALAKERQAIVSELTESEAQRYALSDAIVEFQRRRSDWLAAIDNNKDWNSAHSQISRMLWNEAVMRCVAKAIALKKKMKDDKVPLNAAVFVLLREGYFVQQAMAIRRLADSHFKFEDEAKGVISLAGALENMRKHRLLFTRAAMLRAEGVLYDYESTAKEQIMRARAKVKTTKTNPISARSNWVWAARRHEIIDKLCGVTADKRTPSDVVKPEVFKKLCKRLERCSAEIVEFTNKYLAHAANKTSRGEDDANHSITLKGLQHALLVLVETSDFVTVNLLGKNEHGGLAVPQYDVFEHIHRPLIERKNVAELDKTWHEFDDEVGKWRLGIDALLAEPDSPPTPPAPPPTRRVGILVPVDKGG